MKKLLKIILFAFLGLILTVAVMLFAFPQKLIGLFMPSIEQINTIEANVNKDTAYISTRLIAHNNSFFSIQMDTIKYKIDLFNKQYFQDNQKLDILLKKFSKDTFDFYFKVPYASILKDMKEGHKKRDSTSFAVNLWLKYSTFFGKAELPISKSEKLKIAEPPEIEITDVIYKSQTASNHIRAEVKVKVTNNSKYNLLVNNMDYNIRIVQFANVKGSYAKKVNIKGYSVTYMYLPVDVEMKKNGRSILSIFNSNDKYHYVLVLDALIESPDFKQEKSTIVKITKEDDIKLFN